MGRGQLAEVTEIAAHDSHTSGRKVGTQDPAVCRALSLTKVAFGTHRHQGFPCSFPSSRSRQLWEVMLHSPMPATDRPGTGDGDIQLKKPHGNPQSDSLTALRSLQPLPGPAEGSGRLRAQGRRCAGPGRVSSGGSAVPTRAWKAPPPPLPLPQPAGFLPRQCCSAEPPREGMCAALSAGSPACPSAQSSSPPCDSLSLPGSRTLLRPGQFQS